MQDNVLKLCQAILNYSRNATLIRDSNNAMLVKKLEALKNPNWKLESVCCKNISQQEKEKEEEEEEEPS